MEKELEELREENKRLVILNTNLSLELEHLKDYIKELEAEIKGSND